MLRVTRFAVYTVRKILYLAVSGIVGGALVGIGVYIYQLENRPDLRLWHLAELDSEYGAAPEQAVENFEDYLKLEDRLYRELDAKVRERLRPFLAEVRSLAVRRRTEHAAVG